MISLSWGGDFRHFYSENIADFINFPFAWDSSLNTGIGHSQIGSLWIISYFNFTLLFNRLGLSWNLISLTFWVLPAILLSFLSSLSLFNYLFKGKVKYSLLAGIIYTFNTYFLMILTGGQLGVSLAYSLAPLVLLRFIRIIENPSLTNAIIAGLVLGFQLIFDPRIVYVTLAAVFLFALFSKFKTIKWAIYLIAPFFISILLNIFWILPLILTKSSPIPEGFNSVRGFEFFSFSDLSHALSLLHPNWPENIFGKVYFLQPEFLILPILAFSSFLFISNIKYQKFNILFFALLDLLGVFLAKGASPPFGAINIWLFQNLPGMSMFRDPTKWYILTALSYSVLIPFSILKISERFNDLPRHKAGLNHFIKGIKIENIFLILFLIYLFILIKPVTDRNFKTNVPQEYVELKDFLVSQPEFFRTLWIPQWQRFGYFSNNHPAIGRYEVLKSASSSGQIKELSNDTSKILLKNLGVKYIIVPYDSEREMFLTDRKYNEKERIEAEKMLDRIPWLIKVRFNDLNHLSKIAVYEIKGSKGHFWSPSTDLQTEYETINATEYKVKVKNAKEKDLLIFSESFDRNWFAQNSGARLRSSKYKDLNSFRLEKDGDYELRIYYEPQGYVEAGLWLSLATFLASIGYFTFGKIRKKW